MKELNNASGNLSLLEILSGDTCNTQKTVLYIHIHIKNI